MNRILGTVLLCLVSSASLLRAQDDPAASIEGTIRQVTLYRDQALVTREIKIPPGPRVRSVEIPNLPQLLITASLFAEGDARTTVRAVRVASRPAGQSQRDEVRALDDAADAANRERAATQQALDTVIKDLEALGQMVNFTVVAGQADLNHGVLNAATLTELTTFSMNQRRTLLADQFRHQTRLGDLDKQLQQIKRQRDVLIRGEQKANYSAKIFFETADADGGTIRLNYLVSGCGWSPQYTIRGAVEQPEFDLRYSALVQQMTGEDWHEVKLVLSTASPSVSAARPVLTPLHILTEAAAGAESAPFAAVSPDQSDQLAGMLESLRDQQRAIETRMGLAGETATEHRDVALNSLAGQLQEIELQVESKSWRAVAPDVREDVASQIYAIGQTVSLDSRREQQLVQILETSLKGEMYHVASPLLSTYAYREVQATNTQPLGLIGGPATIYLDGRFVGRMQLPATASGQLLTIGFGADQQVRTRRELLEKLDTVQGGNRQLTFAYRLVLANFKDRPVKVRLMDRMPITRQAQQLSLRLEETVQPLSEDGLYQRMLRPTGVLRWDLDVPANRHGSDAFDVHYRYAMEFDRSQKPATQHHMAEMQAEYDRRGLPSAMGFGGGSFGGEAGGGGFGGGGFGGSPGGGNGP